MSDSGHSLPELLVRHEAFLLRYVKHNAGLSLLRYETPEDVVQYTLDSTATTLGYLNEHRTLLESYEQSLGRDLGFIVLAMGLKPSPSGETFRFFGLASRLQSLDYGELPNKLSQPLRHQVPLCVGDKVSQRNLDG